MTTTNRTITVPDTIDWHVAPDDQGQTIEVAYALCPDGVLQRVTDQSCEHGDPDRVSYYWCREDDVRGSFEPWNEAPQGDFEGPVTVRFVEDA